MNGWSRKRIVFLYVGSLLPGLSSLATSIGINVRDLWQASLVIPQGYTWAGLPAIPKIQYIVEYTALTVLVGLLLSLAFIFVRHSSREVSLMRAERLALSLYLLLCLVLSVFMSSAAIGSVWLMLAGALPTLVMARHWMAKKGFAEAARKASVYPVVCGISLGMLLILLYSTAWSPVLRFSNDFAGLPEYTQMTNGRWVENNRFLQEHRIPGRADLDPCRGEISNGWCVHIPQSAFRSPREAFGLFPSGSGLNYSWDEEKLRTYRAPTPQECLIIDALLQSTQPRCRQLLADGNAQVTPELSSASVAEFFHKNQISLGAQEYLGRFFFHHAYLYLPVLQVLSGAASDAAALPAQYGVGLAVTFAKLLQWTGGHTFQDYFYLYWIGPGVYVLLASATVFALTRRVSLAVAMAALIIGLLPFQAMDGLRLAPGFNPWRHLPDLVCFLAIGLHAARPSVLTALLRAGSIALLLWWNREFGLFMLAGSLVWHFLTLMQVPASAWRVVTCALAELAACGLVMAALAGTSGSNELVFYNLLGVGAPITRWSELAIYTLLWLTIVGFVAWARFRPQHHATPGLEVAGVGLCYAAFTSVYGLWNPSPGHFSVIWISASLPIVCLSQWYFEASERRLGIPQSWMHAYMTIVLSVFSLITSVVAAMQTEATFSKIFQDHRLFNWNFQGITGQTTADPAPVEQALHLLQSEQPTGSVVLISRYDVLLHTASGRLSKLPYVDLPSAVISWPVIDAIAAHVEAAKPSVIFMDRDIFANREWQLWNQTTGFERSVSANYHRVGHLAALAMLAGQVSACYEPGPVGGLLQVWYRRCKG